MAILNLSFTARQYVGDYAAFFTFCLVAILVLLWQKLHVKINPQEPPIVQSKVPFIGHIISLIRDGAQFHHHLGQENPDMPIFTVPMGPTKMYMIASPQLIQQAMRKKTLSFDTLTIAFAERMVGFGPRIMNLMWHPPTDGSENWLSVQHKSYDLLAPGPVLNEMNTHVLNIVAGILNAVGPSYETKLFYLWIRNTFTVATTETLFGSQNPLTVSPTLNDSLWDYETGQINLLLQPFPSLTARRPYQARVALQKALREYFRAGHDQASDVSPVIKKRVAINKTYGLPIDDIADHELGMMFVSVTNAIPTLFWMIYYVFHDEQLVADLQEELLTILEDRKDATGARECIFNVGKFSTDCPLLVSTYNEVMRLTNRQQGTRMVLEDTVLDYTPTGEDSGTPRTYLLKRGTNVQMPSKITHYATAIWGTDPYSFNPRRFITTSREQERQQKRAFNPFGGGKHLCPGRHFAYAEILGAIAALVVGFDIVTPEGTRVEVPPINNNLVEAVGKPMQAVQQSLKAMIRRRPGWEDVKWGYVAGNSL